jgi:ribosome-binding protein aMBF1 (putative translation factor)
MVLASFLFVRFENHEEFFSMEPELVKQMGARVREERLKRHWTLKELVQRANVT